MDHWIQPIEGNVEIFEDVQQLIERELIAEYLLGNPRKKDQINFLYNTLTVIFGSPAREKLVTSEENTSIYLEGIP